MRAALDLKAYAIWGYDKNLGTSHAITILKNLEKAHFRLLTDVYSPDNIHTVMNELANTGEER